MLKERRDFIQKKKAENNGKAPEDLTAFYEEQNADTPLSPEEEELLKKADDEDAKAKKAPKKKDAKKEKGKGKKKKKGGDDGGEGGKDVKIGPSEIVRKFDEFYDDYNEVWANRDEENNPN
jgi:uncharacterized protein with gpF-like domain